MDLFENVFLDFLLRPATLKVLAVFAGIFAIYFATESVLLTAAVPIAGGALMLGMQDDWFASKPKLTEPEPPTTVEITQKEEDQQWDFDGLILHLGPHTLEAPGTYFQPLEFPVHEIASLVHLQGELWVSRIDGSMIRLGSTGLEEEQAEAGASALNDAIQSRRRGGEDDRAEMERALAPVREPAG